MPLVLALLVAVDAQSSPTPLSPGSRVPRFILPDLLGKSFYSVSLNGRPAIIVFSMVTDSMFAPVDELLDLQERYRDRKLGAVIIGYVPQTQRGYRLVPRVQLPPGTSGTLAVPIVLDTQLVAQAFGVHRNNAAFFVDDIGIIRTVVTYSGGPTGYLTQKTALWLGERGVMEKLGWRGDLIATWGRVFEGRFRPPLLQDSPMEAARELRSFARDVVFNIHVASDDESETAVALQRTLVEEAMADWQRALPQLTLKLTSERSQADLVIVFKNQVLNPRDSRGLQTLCAYARTLSDALPAENLAAQRVTALVQIARGHDAEHRHFADAQKKLTVAAVGFGLGLGEREDPESVMMPGADNLELVSRPSADDVTLVRHLWGHLGLRLSQTLIAAKNLNEAEAVLKFIPPGLEQERRAREALKRARETAVSSK